jgi:hypothetical protein
LKNSAVGMVGSPASSGTSETTPPEDALTAELEVPKSMPIYMRVTGDQVK